MDQRGVELPSHCNHIPNDFTQQFLLGGEGHPDHGLQQQSTAIDQCPLNCYRRGHKEVQGVGVYVMVLPTYQSEFGVCDFPTLAPLLQSFGKALPHVVLIAVGQLLFFDNGFKLDPAASGKGFHPQFDNGPAGFGCQVDFFSFGGGGRGFLVDDGGVGEGDLQAVPFSNDLCEDFQLDFAGDPQQEFPAFWNPLQIQEGILLGQLLERFH